MIKPGVEWSPQEAVAVNEFLNTPLGIKWLAVLMSLKPELSIANTEAAALSGAQISGYELFYKQIANLRTPRQVDLDYNKPSIDATKD